MSTTTKRFRSLLVTLAIVATTNIAISHATNKSGMANILDAPGSKSVIAATPPDFPRP